MLAHSAEGDHESHEQTRLSLRSFQGPGRIVIRIVQTILPKKTNDNDCDCGASDGDGGGSGANNDNNENSNN